MAPADGPEGEVAWHREIFGGWSNPFEKYARQYGFIFPK